MDEMLAGRELDVLVAERVLGLPVVWASEPYQVLGRAPREGRFPWLKGRAHGCEYDWAAVPAYSTDIAAAWQVVQSLQGRLSLDAAHGFSLTYVCMRPVRWPEGAHGAPALRWEWEWVATFTTPHGEAWAGAETGALAVCRAALRAAARVAEATR